MNFSDSQVPRNKTLFFNHHDTSLGHHVNAASHKSLEIQPALNENVGGEKLFIF